MASPTSTLTARRLTVAVLSGLALLLASIFIFQPASAQREPGRLKPPFKLVQIEKTQPLVGLPPLPLNAPIVISETFDSTYVTRSNFNTTDPTKWHQVNFNGLFETYTWGQVSGAPITDTVWVARSNVPNLPIITPGTPYTTNMNSLLIYGPINFSDYGAIVVSATYFLDVHVEDSYGLAYSLDGTNFTAVSNEVGRDPTLSTRRTGYYSLPAVARQSQVWLAFYFTSANHPIDALGVFIDEVVVRGVKLNKIYLPLMRIDIPPTPTPTATPTITPTPVANYLYDYSFGTGANSDAQFAIWGGNIAPLCVVYPPNVSCNALQGIDGSGNPSGAMKIGLGGKNTITGVSHHLDGSDKLAPTNFEFSADLYLINSKLDARYGLIFNASDTTFDRDADGVTAPAFHPDRNFYKFELHTDANTDNAVIEYRLQRVENGTKITIYPTSGTGWATLPAGAINGAQHWDTVHVRRVGSNIQVWVNSYPTALLSITDSTFTGPDKFGLFIEAKGDNTADSATQLKLRFDNVRIRPL